MNQYIQQEPDSSACCDQRASMPELLMRGRACNWGADESATSRQQKLAAVISGLDGPLIAGINRFGQEQSDASDLS
jgi:hypothetical protein